MERLYREYGDQVEFLIVYIREAHPEMLKEGNKTGVIGRPETLGERVILAAECTTKYRFTIPMVIDAIAGETAAAYEARTVRTTLVDRDGRVAYYAGRGPWGFKIAEIERALKKLTEHGGVMPPPPEPVWGELEDGLLCGIAVEPDRLVLGETAIVSVEIRNELDLPVALPLDLAKLREAVVFENDRGQTLRFAPEPSGRRPGGRAPRIRAQLLGAGASYRTTIEGTLVAASETEAIAPGAFHAGLRWEVDDETLAATRAPRSGEPLWQGRLHSGRFPFDVSLGVELGCIACHGGEDFHHQDAAPTCAVCHIGEEGCEDFVLVEDSCVRCHPRPEEKGRRTILGEAGEFSLPSVHGDGAVNDHRCRACHDQSRHGDGEVRLIDPRTKSKRLWSGTATEFCLTCHGGAPPEGIRFPDAKGSGYDKAAFVGSAGEPPDCTACHVPHGSKFAPLLRLEGAPSPH